jgi:hypothetical protein
MAADSSKEPKRYASRVAASRKWRSDYETTWRDMVKLYKGKVHPMTAQYEDVAAVNVAKSTVDIIFASTSVRNPKINVFARQPDHDVHAEVTQAVINYWWSRFQVQEEFRAAYKDALVIGHGWLKTTYKLVEKLEPVPYEDRQQMVAEQIAEADFAAAEMPELAGELPTDDEIVELVNTVADEEQYTVVVEDHPQVVRVSPYDMFVDPEATSLRDARWVAQRVIRNFDEARKDKNYREGARRKLQPTAVLEAAKHEDEFGRRTVKDDDAKRVVIWEYYDLENNTLSVWAEGSDQYLVPPTDIPFALGHPFEMMRDYEVPGEFYPMGEVEPIANLQEELNETRTQLMEHRKRYSPKFLAYRHALGPDAQTALKSRKPNQVILVDDTSMPLNQVIVPLEQQPMAADLYNVTSMIHGDIERVSGVNEYMRGSLPNIRRTATEAAILQDAAAARAADKLDIVEKAAARVAERMIALAQQFMSSEQVARIVGEDGAVSWVQYDRDTIAGQFDFEVELGSTLPRNDAVQRQDAMTLLQMMTPYVGQIVDGAELVKMVLRKFGEREPEKFMMQQAPMPEEETDPMMGAGAASEEEMLAQMMSDPNALAQSGFVGSPQAMDLEGAFDAQVGNALSPEMMAQLAQQMGLGL